MQHKTLRSDKSVNTALLQVARAVLCRAEANATSWILKCVSWYLRTKGKVREHFAYPISVISHPQFFFFFFFLMRGWCPARVLSTRMLFLIGSLAFFVIVVKNWNSACFPLHGHQSVPYLNAIGHTSRTENSVILSDSLPFNTRIHSASFQPGNVLYTRFSNTFICRRFTFNVIRSTPESETSSSLLPLPVCSPWKPRAHPNSYSFSVPECLPGG